MSKKVTFYCIADTARYGNWGKKNPVSVKKYEFDWENLEERETMEDYIEDLKPSNFKEACRTFLIETEIDWDQRGIAYILLDEKQYLALQKKLV